MFSVDELIVGSFAEVFYIIDKENIGRRVMRQKNKLRPTLC